MTNFTLVRRTIIIILVAIILFSFVAIINLHCKVEELIKTNDILIEYIGGRKIEVLNCH
jgi:hypothetical protein